MKKAYENRYGYRRILKGEQLKNTCCNYCGDKVFSFLRGNGNAYCHTCILIVEPGEEKENAVIYEFNKDIKELQKILREQRKIIGAFQHWLQEAPVTLLPYLANKEEHKLQNNDLSDKQENLHPIVETYTEKIRLLRCEIKVNKDAIASFTDWCSQTPVLPSVPSAFIRK